MQRDSMVPAANRDSSHSWTRNRDRATVPPWREREMPSAESKVLTTRRGYWPTIRTHWFFTTKAIVCKVVLS